MRFRTGGDATPVTRLRAPAAMLRCDRIGLQMAQPTVVTAKRLPEPPAAPPALLPGCGLQINDLYTEPQTTAVTVVAVVVEALV